MWAPLAPRRVMASSLVNSSFLCTSRQLITQWDLYRCRHVAQAQQTGVYLCQHQARGLVSRRLMIPGVVQATAWVWNTPHLPGWSADLFLPGCLLFVSTGGLSLFCSRCVCVSVCAYMAARLNKCNLIALKKITITFLFLRARACRRAHAHLFASITEYE